MDSIRQYIIKNNFDPIPKLFREEANHSAAVKILLDAIQLNLSSEESIIVHPSNFIAEFNRGLDSYFLLAQSTIHPESFQLFSKALWILFKKVIDLIEDRIIAMKQRIDLNFEDDPDYYDYYQIWGKLQLLINFLNKRAELVEKLQLAKIKARLSNLLDYEIDKTAIGNDMLQLAEAYLVFDEKKKVLTIYNAILKDFAQGYPISISNGQRHAIGKTIIRVAKEIEIYDQARIAVKHLTGEEFPILQEREKIIFETKRSQEKKSIWEKVKSIFRI